MDSGRKCTNVTEFHPQWFWFSKWKMAPATPRYFMTSSTMAWQKPHIVFNSTSCFWSIFSHQIEDKLTVCHLKNSCLQWTHTSAFLVLVSFCSLTENELTRSSLFSSVLFSVKTKQSTLCYLQVNLMKHLAANEPDIFPQELETKHGHSLIEIRSLLSTLCWLVCCINLIRRLCIGTPTSVGQKRLINVGLMQSKEWHKSQSNFQTALKDFFISIWSVFIYQSFGRSNVSLKNCHDKLTHLKVTWWN